MKKKNRTIVASVLALLLIGGGVATFLLVYNARQQAAAERQQRLDSLHRVDSIMKAEEAWALLERQRQDSIENATFTTPDLAMFGLSGHISSATITSCGDMADGRAQEFRTVSYSREGMLTQYSGQHIRFSASYDERGHTLSATANDTAKVELGRNGDYQLIWVSGNGWKVPFVYNSRHHLSRIGINGDYNSYATSFEYDLQGRLLSATYAHTNEDGIVATELRYVYDYTAFDDHGNWTERHVDVFDGSIVATPDIDGQTSEEFFDDSYTPDPETSAPSKSFVQTCTIRYY